MTNRILGHDIASKMLSALMDGSPHTADVNVSLDDQKRYLKKHIDSVGVPTRLYIAQLLVESGRKEAIKACSEGIVINLDALTSADVRKMYDALIYERDHRRGHD